VGLKQNERALEDEEWKVAKEYDARILSSEKDYFAPPVLLAARGHAELQPKRAHRFEVNPGQL